MVAVFLCVVIMFFDSVCFFQAEDGIRDLVRSRGLGDVYKRQGLLSARAGSGNPGSFSAIFIPALACAGFLAGMGLSLIHI